MGLKKFVKKDTGVKAPTKKPKEMPGFLKAKISLRRALKREPDPDGEIATE